MLGSRRRLLTYAVIVAALLMAAGLGWAPPLTGEVLESSAASEFDVIATLTAQPQWTAGARFEVKINDQDPERGYLVRIEKGRATILKRRGDKAESIGTSGPVSFSGDGEHRISVKRREIRLVVLVDGHIVARANDHAYGGGEVSYRITGEGLNFSKVRYQPIDNIYFADDFTRTSSDLGSWEPKLGSWQLSYRLIPTRASNAFWCVGQADEAALLMGGRRFWDHYSIQTAVRPTRECEAIGLAFYCQDEKNYLAFRWTANRPEQPGKREIIEVADGETRVLGSAPGGFDPSEYQWYRLRVNVSDHSAVGLIDGIVVVHAPLDGPGEGRVGLYAFGSVGSYFDDVLVRSYKVVQEDFEPETFAAWQREGKWSNGGEPGVQKATGEASAIYGFPHWADYTYVVDALTGNGKPIGVYFSRENADNYYLYRSSSAGQELVRVANGRAETVDSAKPPLSANRWHTMQIQARGGYVRVLVDGAAALDNYSDGPTGGAIGLYAGPGAVGKFRRLRLYFAEEPAPDERVPERFAVDPHMRDWATRAGDWLNPNPAAPGQFWRRGDFHGDLSAEFQVEEIREQVGSVTVALAADGESFNSGYQVIVSHPEGADHVVVQLHRGDRLIREAKGPLPEADETTLVGLVERRGRFIAVTLGDRLVMQYRDRDPLTGSRVGFTSSGLYARINDVIVTGANQLEHTFNVAPVNWVIRGGVWGVQPRYGCDPRWSFFGGWAKGVASIWHKQPVKGDVTFDVYGAIKMEFPGEDYAERWRDLNLTICADGEHVNSGYTLIHGGWHNTYTRLLRGNEIVAETNKFLMPKKDEGHRSWIHVTLQKKGQHILAHIGNQPVFDYLDPSPLTGEHCAIWTRDNGIMVARANLYYGEAVTPEHPSPGYSPPELPVATQARLPLVISSPTHPVISNDFEVDVGQFGARQPALGCRVGLVNTEPTQGRYCLAAINAYPAADFALNLRSTIFDAAKLPKLSFDYRFPKGAPLNLCLETGDGKAYTILMTGKELEDYPTIGKIAGAVADGTWHHAEIDLAECLAEELKDPPYKVKSIWLADRSAPPDLYWYGFGDIPGGSWLYLDNFALRGPGDRDVAFEWSPMQGAQVVIPLLEGASAGWGGGARVIRHRGGKVEVPVVEGGLVAVETMDALIDVRPEGDDAAVPAAIVVPMPAEATTGETLALPPPPPPVEMAGYAYVFDRKPDTEAPKESKGSATSAKFTADRPGLWYLHLRAKAKDGTWGDTFHCGVLVK